MLRSARATVMPIAAPDWHEDPESSATRDMDEAMFAALYASV
jgi:hypothetical protein